MLLDGTVIFLVGQPIRLGHREEFVEWQKRVTDAASRFAGSIPASGARKA